MTSGWTRWILEQFEFPFERVFAPELDAGNLNAKYDVLIFVDGAIPGARRRRAAAGAAAAPAAESATIPAEYRAQLGRVTAEQTHSAAQRSSSRTAARSSRSATRRRTSPRSSSCRSRITSSRTARRCRARSSSSRARCSRAQVDTTHPLAAGHDASAPTSSSTTARCSSSAPDAAAAGVRAIAWFDSPTPLRSGWAWGQKYLEGGVVAVEAHGRQGPRRCCSARRSSSARSRTARSSCCSTRCTGQTRFRQGS